MVLGVVRSLTSLVELAARGDRRGKFDIHNIYTRKMGAQQHQKPQSGLSDRYNK